MSIETGTEFPNSVWVARSQIREVFDSYIIDLFNTSPDCFWDWQQYIRDTKMRGDVFFTDLKEYEKHLDNIKTFLINSVNDAYNDCKKQMFLD